MPAPGTRRARWGAVLRTSWFKVTAAAAATGALVAGGFLAGGYDVAQTKVDDASVWALQSGSNGERYARVDTALGQLDTVKSITSPSELVQASGQVLLYSQNQAKVASVDLAQPASYTAETTGFSNTPEGTRTVVNTGDYLGYLTNTGAVYATRVEDATKRTQPIPAPGSDGKRTFGADSIAIGTDGILYAYSHTTREMLRFDVRAGRVLGTDAVRGGPARPGSTLTVVGDDWALLSKDGASLWVRGLSSRVSTGLNDAAVLQQPSAQHDAVAIGGADRLISVDLSSGRKQTLETGVTGQVAAPLWQDSRLYAAWVGTGSGSVWSGHAGLSGTPKTLALKSLKGYTRTAVMQSQPEPVFRSNGGNVILNDVTSGWLWSVPSGSLVQGSQNWNLDQTRQTTQPQEKEQTEREANPKPPTAVADAFGVRAGSLVTLPVMLNDYDPNGDVLSIVPGSVTGLPAGFGTASIANNGQTVTVQVAQNAPPSATFSYAVTDGTAANGGLKSAPAKVTLTVSAAGKNSAPRWCNGIPDDKCLLTWPNNTGVAPGGSVEIPVLRGWVDPDGDAMYAQASSPDPESYTVSVAPDGNLVFQPSAEARPGPVTVPVWVSDVNGAKTMKELRVSVTESPTMRVEDFGLMTAADVPLTVDPSSHIRGAKGSPQIVSATLATSSSSSPATATVDSSGTTFEFSAAQPGSYPVTMTVRDTGTGSAQTATVRITVVDASHPLLSTAPVTVFVRPQTDTSVDVFSAVQNPTGRVLLLSSPRPKPAPGASLDVDVVGQSQLRVRGTTGSGQEGLLGTVDYTVSDGTNTANMRVQGRATVYLLPDEAPSRPVAVNDSVTVRAGAQVDIPVLANDVAANGDVVELDPSSVQNPSRQGLAFASGQVLRYLAPTTPPANPITLRYYAYTAGNPAQKALATVTVKILRQGSDRPPVPDTLTGRVVAGASVRIPFDPYGVDPDGDMVSLDRVMSQPQDGTAQISADGTAIIFTALADSEGQQTFSYRVRDSEGETGEASVMVGVLNAQTDPAPVTFSDYVQVQAGAENQVVVQPTANDVDPSGGALTLIDVTPDAPPSSSLYSLLRANIASHDDTQVVIRSMAIPRTLTYTYSVKNAQGDVSAGLIVVDVVNGRVPDYPVAVDTVVDAGSRGRLAAGIDVVQGKVSWGSGDVGGLELALYGKHAGVSVSGDLIKVAKVPAAGLLIPFQLTGPDFTGQQVTTYGFLRVPSEADVILALKAGKVLKVPEGGSSHVTLSDIVISPPDTALNAQSGKTQSRARKGSTCTIEAGVLTYSASDGPPWIDACIVPVRIVGQQEYTMIAVPVQIQPKQPEPQLRPASLTASPGQKGITFDLRQMTTWIGHTNFASLRYRAVYSGSQFTVVQHGKSITVRARDTAQPGLEDVVHVSILGYSSVGTAADITLKVGPAPSIKPAGGSTSLSCSEAQGASCSTRVVGLRDEVNAYSDTPLKVVGVSSQVPGCTGVTFSVADSRTIAAHWGADAPGGTCTVPFIVQGAQGRRSDSGAGNGKLSFELKGYPAAPASVAQVAYTASSVTLAVTPGSAASAYPALTGFRIYMDGKSAASCDVNGACPPITGLKNGDKHTFEAKAVNSVGESRTAVSTTGWAFTQPVVSGVTVKSVYDQNITSPTTGAFDVTIPETDESAGAYLVEWSGNSQTVQAGGGSVTVRLSAAAGSPTAVAVTPVSEYTQPPGDKIGAQAWSGSVTPAGTPSVSWSGGGFTSTNSSITVNGSVSGSQNGSDKPGSYLYLAVPPGFNPSCSNSGDASLNYSKPSGSDWSTSGSQTIGGLTQFHSYDIYVCYTNQYGATTQRLISGATAWAQPGAPTGWTYTIVNTTPAGGLPSFEFQGNAPSGGSVPDNYTVEFADSTQGYTANYSYPDIWGAAPGITVKYCGTGFLSLCTSPGNVTAAQNSAPYQLRVTKVAESCTADATSGALTGTLTLSGDGIDAASVGISSYSYVDAGGTTVTVADAGNARSVTLEAGQHDLRITGYQITLPSGFARPAARGAVPLDSSCTG
jgi:hypothetical protein